MTFQNKEVFVFFFFLIWSGDNWNVNGVVFNIKINVGDQQDIYITHLKLGGYCRRGGGENIVSFRQGRGLHKPTF